MPFVNRSGDREIDYRDEEQWRCRQKQIRGDIEEVGAACALHRWRDRLIAEDRLCKERRPIKILIPEVLQSELELSSQEVTIHPDNSLTQASTVLAPPSN